VEPTLEQEIHKG
jgi:transposase InsO family protein